MPRKRLFAAAVCALVAVLAFGLIRARSGSAHEPAGAKGRAAGTATLPPKKPVAKPVQAAAPPSEAAAPEKAPRSLEGTDVDGGLDVGPDGRLVVGPRVLALFDYFLSAAGEESDAAIRARIEAYAREHLDEPALGEALGLLGKYMAYREAGKTLRIPEGGGAAERLAAVRELRRAHFGDDAAALFGDDERIAEVAIEKSRIAKDEALSPEDREDLLADAEKRLPEAARAARAKATSVLDLRADEAALRADGADEDVIRRYRESKLGPEAADRLEALDRQRAAFKARVEAFRQERDVKCGKLADASGCEANLLESAFEPRERIRVRTILSMPAN